MTRPLWNQIVGWLLTALIIIGNGLVICLITTRRKLRTTTNCFALSLAVADFGVAVGAVCAAVAVAHEIVLSNHVTIYIWYFPIYASVVNLCALTLDRYLAIVKPLSYMTFMTKKRVTLLIFAAWSVAFLVLIPHIVLSAERYAFISSGILNISVFVFLLFATARIFLIVRKHSRQNAAVIKQLNFNHALHCKVSEPHEAAAKMVYIVVTVFASFSLLNMYVTFCEYSGLCRPYESFLTSALELVLLTNSAVNPIAYAYFKREIRKELKRLFCSKGLVFRVYYVRTHRVDVSTF